MRRRPEEMSRRFRMREQWKCAIAAIAVYIAFPTGAAAQTTADALADLGVADLMNVEVTSVSRRVQKLSDTAAAVFVISQDDIRRSGATTIPELLRMVPGFQVARANGTSWAVS